MQPTNLEELRAWLEAQGVESEVADSEIAWDGYYIVSGPKYWMIFVKNVPMDGLVVRCDSEKDVVECFIEIFLGRDNEPQSLTSFWQNEVRRRIENSWSGRSSDREQLEWPELTVALENVCDRESFLHFVRLLSRERYEADQLLEKYPDVWEPTPFGWYQHTLHGFFDAGVSAVECDFERLPKNASWKAFAEFLYLCKVRE